MIRRGCYQPKLQLLGGVRTREEDAHFHGVHHSRVEFEDGSSNFKSPPDRALHQLSDIHQI